MRARRNSLAASCLSLSLGTSCQFSPKILLFTSQCRLSDEQAFRVVDALVTHSELPAILIRSLTVSLFKALVEQSSTESHSKIRSLLVQVQQRHPDVLQNSYDDMLETDSDKKDVLEQALLSLSMVSIINSVSCQWNSLTADAQDLPGTTKKLDSVVGSMNADSNVRIIAVRELYEKLKTGDSEEKVRCLLSQSRG